MLINTLPKFLRHVNLHRRRVYLLGLALGSPIKNDRAYRTALRIHDIEKYFFIFPLFKYYGGKNPDRLAAQKLYARMNAVGLHMKNVVLLPFNLTADDRRLLDSHERIADVADRHCDPIAMEEFNLKVQKPISIFLDHDQVLLSEHIVDYYDEIVQGYEF